MNVQQFVVAVTEQDLNPLKEGLKNRSADRLAAVGLRTLMPNPDAIYATSKLRLPKFCHDNGIPAPRTIHVLDQGDLPLHADQFGYPMFIKGTVAGAKRAANVAQATAAARGLNRTWGGGVLLQEVIEGEEYNVAAVLARDHSISAMVSIKKVGVNEKGKGVMCTVVDDPAIERHAVSVLEALDWCGPVELEFVLPKGAKAPSLIEVNCRFPSWILLSHWADCSLPAVLLEEILGQRPGTRVKARPGTSFVRDIAETAVPLAQLDRLARFGSVAGQAPAPTANRRADPDGLAVAVTGISTLDVVNAGSGRNTATTDKFPNRILPRKFDAGFSTGLMHKDVALFLDEAALFGVPTWVGHAVHDMWQFALMQDGPDVDFTTIVKHAEGWAGAELKGKGAK